MIRENWDLSILYNGLDDPKYEKDIAFYKNTQQALHEALLHETEPKAEWIASLITLKEQLELCYTRLYTYLHLREATAASDTDAKSQLNRVGRMAAESSADESAFLRALGSVEDVEALSRENSIVAEYVDRITEAKKACAHLLSNEEESVIAQMAVTGGDAWSKLHSHLMSSVTADYHGKALPLSQIRNLAYDPDPTVRKESYEAELACYPKIADSVAFALNNIKAQVISLAEKRGYDSPLDQALSSARMEKKTLDAMMGAVKEYLPVFHKYLKAKAKHLGYENGLPWYELYAPVGENGEGKQYTLEEARDYLVERFTPFSKELADLMAEAFDNGWIDFFPRNGKRGGAFCSGIRELGQSRVLTNFSGSFRSVNTLAHELGHAFHNRQLETARPLNWRTPMPVAETASTFDEVYLGAHVLAEAAPEERLALLESDLQSKTGSIVDIYSRYLFETEVFARAKDSFLMTDDLCKLMLECQKEAYGDGLDHTKLNPYMWVCKIHYYMPERSFYNYPYMFGCLFAGGLYRLYEKQGDAFVENYKKMLRHTPVQSIEQDGLQMGVDLTDPAFWRESLEAIAKEVDEYCALLSATEESE